MLTWSDPIPPRPNTPRQVGGGSSHSHPEDSHALELTLSTKPSETGRYTSLSHYGLKKVTPAPVTMSGGMPGTSETLSISFFLKTVSLYI
jgi:hypothetical protein